jgi:FtsZ-binding cell division protein ZapB
MSDKDVFASDDANQETPAQTPEQNATPEANQEQPQDVFADKLSSITNADGTPKYTDVAQALDSIPHAQKHISTIEEENALLKAELAKAQAAKELLEKSAGKADQQPTGLTAEEVEAITQQTLAKQAEASRKEDNVNSVSAKFSELYGDKATDQMKALAVDSGMSIQEIRTLAEKSPLAVYRMAGINAQSTPVPKTPGSGVGDNFQPSNRPVADPKPVMSGATSKQMVDNWRAAGEKIKQQQ